MKPHDPTPTGLRFLFARGVLYWWISYIVDRCSHG